jgi:fermentation-respiration switch protein FrsA (DUF1100 family)
MIVVVLIPLILLLVLSIPRVQTAMLFYPERLNPEFRFDSTQHPEEVFLRTEDGQTINGLFFRMPGEKVILYFHGNAGNLDSWQYVYKDLQNLHISLFIIDYRGFGKSTGGISETGLYEDAGTAFAYLLRQGFKNTDVVIYGRSIGTAVAIDLASKDTVSSVILECPFYDFGKLVNEKIPLVPIPSFLLAYKFDNPSKISRMEMPLLVLQGDNDEVIPPRFGRELYDAYKGRKYIVTVKGGRHNTLSEFAESGQSILLFLSIVDKSH